MAGKYLQARLTKLCVTLQNKEKGYTNLNQEGMQTHERKRSKEKRLTCSNSY